MVEDVTRAFVVVVVVIVVGEGWFSTAESSRSDQTAACARG
jgi:hypothetical protein